MSDWKPKVGETAFLKGIQNWTRGIEGEWVISKVGRKYFTAGSYRFHIAPPFNQVSECSASIRAFRSRIDWEQEEDRRTKRRDVEEKIRQGSHLLSLGHLTRIESILNETTPQ
jgi:hypothetical protein